MKSPAIDRSPPLAFPPTMWSMVRLAVADGQPGADKALNDLCKLYEGPILAFILRKGHAPDTAEDLKQSFFEHLLEKNALSEVACLKLKLRAFLITKLQGFLIDRHRHDTAQKRGWGQVVRMADLSETQALLTESVEDLTPVVAFHRQWLETIAANAMRELHIDYTHRGLSSLFVALAPFITGAGETSLAELSQVLKRPEGTLKSDISRLRAKCQALIRNQIAATLDDPTPEKIAAELRELMASRS